MRVITRLARVATADGDQDIVDIRQVRSKNLDDSVD